ncbi:MAG: TonB-dependent receptor plug domain-containing protein [Spirochaetales bacterium]|nr:TonB-dependent receptor plug domain-containing protein [Spirochaetales bacterium]
MPLIPLRARDIVIIVVDADIQLPLEGAVIHSWDGGQYECDENGKVKLSTPDDRQTVVRAAYPGYENGRLVITPGGENSFTIPLRLDGVMESRELVVEEQRPGTGESKSGRSVAIADKDLSRTAEIGVVEDVMTSIKLLPGVGYSGGFNAMPSIRGGFPGDLTAVLDGFYIEQPYHWGGSVSIFDPKMIQSARLSHGVFSARYGHTVSGLLELSSRVPSATEVEMELGVSTSATNFSLSQPLGGKGGVMLMGKVTYWDPFIWAAKQQFSEVRSIRTAPYIRSGAISAYYPLSPDLNWTLNGFFGTDGVAVFYEDDKADLDFVWENRIGFISTGLTWTPAPDKIFKAAIGAGFSRAVFDTTMKQSGSVRYSNDFITEWQTPASYPIDRDEYIYESSTSANYQGRLDFDWELGKGFIAALGGQELYSQWRRYEDVSMFVEEKAPGQITAPGTGLPHDYYIGYPFLFNIDTENQAFTSSAYALVEYSGGKKFGAELGLRLDHLYFIGRDFTIQTMPMLNPRLNLDFGILENAGAIDSLGLTLGTGLFSSINDTVPYMDSGDGIEDFELKQNRAWTSVAGTKIEFASGFSFNIEGYYKYIFDRAYQNPIVTPTTQTVEFKFNGEGHVWGFDLMLQKYSSRYWDGWLSYSFTHARYRDPDGVEEELHVAGNDSVGSRWYYPSFHRFHTLNLVLNLKPASHFNIATRLGFASGVPKKQVGPITSYPVELQDGSLIEKWKRSETYSDTARTGFSLPLDMKFSFFTFDKKGKVKAEIYFAIENLLALVYTPKGNADYDSYTGKEEEDSDSAYEIPIPLPSFGFKWSY